MQIPMNELERIVFDESKTAVASHRFNHFLRVAKGAGWFCKVLHASEHEKEIAYAAGLLHDIVRPPTEKYDPLEDAMRKSRVMLQKLNIKKVAIDEIIDAIYAHHHPDPKKKAGYAVFLADKILEGMGAYIVFRRAVFMGESPDFAGIDRTNATLDHWAARINKWNPSRFEERFSDLVDFQFSWCSRFLDAFRQGMEWALHLNNAGFEAGAKGISTDEFLASFKPSFKEEGEFIKEAVSYIHGEKFSIFARMIGGAK